MFQTQDLQAQLDSLSEDIDYDLTTCKECKSSEIFADRSSGDYVCCDCGLVQGHILDENTGTNYTDDFGVSNNTSHHHCSIDSTNPYDDGSIPLYPKGYIQEFTGKDGNRIKFDMSRMNVRYIPHKQKAFYHVSELLKGACERLSTTFCLENAKALWAVIAKSGIVKRGANRKGLIGNCLLYATHWRNYPRSQDEVASALFIKSTDITKGFKYFRELMLPSELAHVLDTMNTHQSRFSKFIRLLGIPYQYNIICERTYEKYSDYLTVVAPNSAIAGIIYWVVKNNKIKNVTKQDIKIHVGVCIPTLNKVMSMLDKLTVAETKE